MDLQLAVKLCAQAQSLLVALGGKVDAKANGHLYGISLTQDQIDVLDSQLETVGNDMKILAGQIKDAVK